MSSTASTALAELGATWRQAYSLDTAVLPWADHAAVLTDLARRRGLADDDTLARAGVRHGHSLSPRQLLALCASIAPLGKDLPFALGPATLPGHFGLASQALLQSRCASDALAVLCAYPARLCPLLTPRLSQDSAGLTLRWTDACGSPAWLRPFLVDWHMAAVIALTRLCAGRALPWVLHFNRTAPADLAHHAVHLGRALHFQSPQDAMRLSWGEATAPWGTASAAASTAAMDAHRALAQGADPNARRRPYLAALYDWLSPQTAQAPTLAQAAETLGVSTATLKRQLAAHGTHFQAELDRVRADQAWHLQQTGHPPSAIAASLGFADVASYRRSYRRWTGLAPG